jgi:hypothetical protein
MTNRSGTRAFIGISRPAPHRPPGDRRVASPLSRCAPNRNYFQPDRNDRPAPSGYRRRRRRCRPPPSGRRRRQEQKTPVVSISTALCSSSRKYPQRVRKKTSWLAMMLTSSSPVSWVGVAPGCWRTQEMKILYLLHSVLRIIHEWSASRLAAGGRRVLAWCRFSIREDLADLNLVLGATRYLPQSSHCRCAVDGWTLSLAQPSRLSAT